MQHATDEDLILHYYGELSDCHVAACRDCTARYEILVRTLDQVEVPVPPRPLNYEEQVWRRLRPKLPARRVFQIPTPVWAAAAAACLVLAFSAGRYHSPSLAPQPAAAVRERVLIIAVGNHLERSRVVLAELANAKPDPGATESLLEENRLYRQTALSTGDRQVASLLEDLERVLLEVAHTPESASAVQWQDLRERVEAQGLAFKINVFESQLQKRVAKPTADQL